MASGLAPQPTRTPVLRNASASIGSDRKSAAADTRNGLSGASVSPALLKISRVVMIGIELSGSITTVMPLPSWIRCAPTRALSSPATLTGRLASRGSTSGCTI